MSNKYYTSRWKFLLDERDTTGFIQLNDVIGVGSELIVNNSFFGSKNLLELKLNGEDDIDCFLEYLEIMISEIKKAREVRVVDSINRGLTDVEAGRVKPLVWVTNDETNNKEE